MASLKDQNNLGNLRDRLYARGEAGKPKNQPKETDASDATAGREVSRDWKKSAAPKPSALKKAVGSVAEKLIKATPKSAPPETAAAVSGGARLPRNLSAAPAEADADTNSSSLSMPKKRKKTYRLYALGVVFFMLVITMGISIAFLFFDGNQVSPRNVSVEISGPFSVGGGETLPLEVTISNDNPAALRSATLVLAYPPGTRSVGEDSRNVSEERVPLADIEAGETRTIPAEAVVFGEENQELSVNATVEYRIEGSNNLFFSEADEALRFKIGSSPLFIDIDTVSQISAGQEMDITLTVQSNSPNTLNNVVVKASYPDNFDFSSATPEPVLGQNTWRIDSIEPEESAEITISGVVLGQEADEFEIAFEAGTVSDAGQLQLDSPLTTATANVTIERPFIDVKLSINGDTDGTAILAPGQQPQVSVSFTNTLDSAIYDLYAVGTFSGNAFSEENIRVDDGFYDSADDEVRWDQSSIPELAQMLPGDSEEVSFSLTPADAATTPEMEVTVDVYARRVTQSDVSEELIGTASGVAQFSTEVNLGSEVVRESGDTGPIPPEVEQVTEYTVNLVARNGTNDVTNSVVTFQLPPYVSWQDEYDGDGTVTFNPVSKEATWDVGDIEANQTAELSFGLGMRPSRTQLNETPTLINAQRFRGTDRFTGAVIRNEASAKTSELSQELGFPRDNGTVVESD